MDKWTVGEGRLFRLAGDSVLIMCAGRGLSITIGSPQGSIIMQQDGGGGGRALHPYQWGTWVASHHPVCSRRPLSREGAEMSSNNENTTTTSGSVLCRSILCYPRQAWGRRRLEGAHRPAPWSCHRNPPCAHGQSLRWKGWLSPAGSSSPPALQPRGRAAGAPGAPSCDPAPFTNLQAAAPLLASVPGMDEDPWDGLCPRPMCTPPQRLAFQQIRHRNPAVDQTPVVKVLQGEKQATCPSHLQKPMS